MNWHKCCILPKQLFETVRFSSARSNACTGAGTDQVIGGPYIISYPLELDHLRSDACRLNGSRSATDRIQLVDFTLPCSGLVANHLEPESSENGINRAVANDRP